MGQIKFNLRNPKSENKTSIILVFHFDGEKIRISTRISIIPKYWNLKNQRVKERMDFPEHNKINQKLNEISLAMISTYNELIEKEGIASKDTLKEKFYLKLKMPKLKKVRKKQFWNYFEEFIVYKRKQLNDIRDYNNSLRKHLLATEKILNRKATFEGIKQLDGSFIETMEHYLIYDAKNQKGEKGLSVNTIGKNFKNLKVFLNYCFEREICPWFSTKHLIAKQEIVDEVYITQKELDSLSELKLKGELRLQVRDAFILGCETALRFSDLRLVKPSHIDIKGKRLRMHHKKTKKKVVIPLSTKAIEILREYKNFSPIKSNTTITDFNRIIKEVCEKAEINATINQYRTIRGERLEIEKLKYEMVTSHTCRRTFCTLKVLNEVPVPLIMKISGHTTERNFFRYLKMDEETSAEKMSKYIN